MKRTKTLLATAACAGGMAFAFNSGAVQFAGTGTGAIPDSPAGGSLCNVTGNDGTPLVVSFNVSGLTNPISSVGLRTNITHSFRGDLALTLAAPGGSPSLLIMSHTGSTTPTGCGSGNDLAGVYNFGDGAAGNWWTTLTNPTPPGDYRTSTAGDAAGGGALTSLSTVFSGLAPGAANGTWTLTIVDSGDGDTGTINQGTTLFIDEPVPVQLQNFTVE